MKKDLILLGMFATMALANAFCQGHEREVARYVPPTEPKVMARLAQWQDRKFGLMMHWGTYSQWGIVESWSLCPEDEGWCERKGPYKDDWYQYKKAYEALQHTFNPISFDPAKWSAAAKQAGMQYVVFTTKHHDGFCMFDTKLTEYSIMHTPFGADPRGNIAFEVFKAFRNDGFMTGAYFSKPDWHSEDYWWPYFPPKDRNPSYHPAKYPDRWERFKSFTYRQIEELMRDYGQMDILWLDGGWVRPWHTIDTAVTWQKAIPFDQDIDMARIARRARELQPGLLIVDRTVGGEFENYITPEQQVPDGYLPVPWETCMTLGGSWSYVPGDRYKPARQIIHLLSDIVSRNGNLLLNIAPGPGGDFDPVAYERLREIGSWMAINGEAIYGTRADSAMHAQGKLVFTRKGGDIYAIYKMEEGEEIPETIRIKGLDRRKIVEIQLLGYPAALKWLRHEDQVIVRIPKEIDAGMMSSFAWVLRVRG